jgi:hypothetical protein
MINTDAIVFYSFAVIIITLSFRPIFITSKVLRYVKKYHRDSWEENIHLFWNIGRANIFQVIKRIGLNDPKINDYKKEWDKAIKQLPFAALLVTILSFCYLAFYKHNGILGKILYRKIVGTFV